jgi:hypothetical protein
MEFGEFMAFAVVVGGMIAIVRTMAEVYKRKLALREREIELQLQHRGSSEGSASADTIARLEDRVRVLERIATDKSEAVAAQIEALRDERTAPVQAALAKEIA